MPFLRKWRGVFLTLRSSVPIGFEIGMCVLSLRAAYVLFSNPLYFDQNEHNFHVIDLITPEEWKWGVLASIAATLKIVGFLGFFASTEAMVERAFLVRAAGWACAFVFWSCMGVSFLAWNPNTLSSGSTLMLGIFSLGMVLAGPVLPERLDGR